jgi:hypothetical protein
LVVPFMSVDAIRFVRKHGIVLESAKGSLPNLARAVAGAPVRGSWWNHKDSKKIFQATWVVRDSEDVLVCRLFQGKITYVHRRLWPAVVRLAHYFQRDALAAIREVHSSSGAHTLVKLPYPKWVPPRARQQAKTLPEARAVARLGRWVTPLMRRSGAGPQR